MRDKQSNEHKFYSLSTNDDTLGEEEREFTCDEAIEKIGFGKMQLFLCVLCGMLWSADAMEMMLLSFLLSPGSPCVAQLNLNSWQRATIGSAVFVGMMFGSVTWGLISDRFGRKIVFVLTSCVTGIVGLISSFAPNYIALLILRGIVGFGIGGAHVAFSLFAEYLPQNNRGKPLILFEIFWSIGTVAEAALAWAVLPTLGWRWLLGFSSIPVLLLIACYPVLPESPRYLLVNRNPDRAHEQLQYAAKLNKVPMPRGKLIVQTTKSNDLKFYQRLYLLVSKSMLKVSLLMWSIWFSCNFVYYGMVLITPALYASESNSQNQVFLGILISSLAEIPGLFIAAFGVDKLGRKKTLGFMFIGCSVALALIYFKSFGQAWLIIMSILSRMFIMGSFSSVYVYTQEIYPTMIRSSGLGVCSSISRIAGIITPFIAEVFTSLWIPIVVYSSAVLFAGVASFLLPFETQGKPTQEVVQDDQQQSEEQTPILSSNELHVKV